MLSSRPDVVVIHEYIVDTARQCVRLRVSGVLTADALRVVFDDLRGDARITPQFCALIDFRGIRSIADLTHDTVRSIASGPLDTVARRAFVATDPAVFGICRMFATYRELAGREPVVVCRSIYDAEQWLGLFNEPPAAE